MFEDDGWVEGLEVSFGGVRREGESVEAVLGEVGTNFVPEGTISEPVVARWKSKGAIGAEEGTTWVSVLLAEWEV